MKPIFNGINIINTINQPYVHGGHGFFWKFGEPQRHGFLDLPDKEREKVPEVLAKARPFRRSVEGWERWDGKDGKRA